LDLSLVSGMALSTVENDVLNAVKLRCFLGLVWVAK